jgi:hypothetical protein
MSSLMFDIYLRATPQQVRSVLTEPAMVPSWLDGLRFSPAEEEDPGRLTCEWLQTERLEINGGASSVVRFDLVAMGQVTRLRVSHFGLEPDGSLLKAVAPGWPMILSSLKSLMETGEPLAFRAAGGLRVGRMSTAAWAIADNAGPDVPGQLIAAARDVSAASTVR